MRRFAEGDIIGLDGAFSFARTALNTDEDALGDEGDAWIPRWPPRRPLGEFADEFEVEARKLTLLALRYAFEQGWLIRIEMTSEGYRPWNASPDETIEEISGRWEAWGRHPNMADMIWFADPAAPELARR